MSRLRTLAAMLALLAGSHAGAGDYSNAFFFGDSLSDAGSFAPALPPGTGRFTTNPGPVWPEALGARLGIAVSPANQGGNDYAEGGARVSQLPGVPPAPPTASATPLRDQVGRHLAANGGRADPRALYSVWAGANDLFVIAPSATSDPAGTQTYLQASAGALAGEVARLHAAGARQIVVWTVPDIGATPFGTSQGAAGAAGLTQLSAGFNQLLGLSLAASGVPVIRLDSFALLNEVIADPARYGFTNATLPACGATPSLLCTSASLVAPGAAQDFVFADGVHPSTGGHALIADYLESMLRAPSELGLLAETPIRSQVALSRRLWRNAELALSTPGPSGSGAWAEAEGGRLEFGDADGTPWSLTVGADRRIADGLVLGGALSSERVEPDFAGGGSFSARDLALSAYFGWRHGALSVVGNLSLASTEYESDREIRLGAARRVLHGAPEGNRGAAGLRASYAMVRGALHHGPLAALLVQEVSVQSFAERAGDGSSSSSLTYGKQRRRSTQLTLGWQAFMRAGTLTPYGSIEFTHDAEGSGRKLEVATSLSPSFVERPTATPEQSYATLKLGAVVALARAMLNVELAAAVGADGFEDTRVSAGVRLPF